MVIIFIVEITMH